MRLIKKIIHSIKSRGLKETLLIIINDILFSLRYKVKFKESIPLNFLKISSPNQIYGIPYQGSSYYYVKMAFRNLPVDFTQSSLIDFGSGKGNVLLMSHNLGFKKILGIEFARDLVKASEKNIKNKIIKNFNTEIEVICFDATLYDIPTNYNVFYFYNPFNSIVFEKVLINIERSLEVKKRTIFLIYINVVLNKNLFLKFNYNIIFNHSSKEKSEILILSK